jgi:uncharacterized protein YxjI
VCPNVHHLRPAEQSPATAYSANSGNLRICDTYGVEVEPGQNDALMIAIAVCLDRIHQEEEERHG